MAKKEHEMLFQIQASMGSSFNSAFQNASSTMQSMQLEINALNKTQGDISAYQKQQAAVEQTANKLQLYKDKLKALESTTDEASQKTYAYQNKQLTLQSQIAATEAKLKSQTEKLDSMGDALTEAGVDTGDLTNESKRLAEELDDVKQAQDEAAESAEEYGEAGTTSIDAVASALAAAGIAAAMKEIYNAYMECVSAAGDFEAAMSQVEALSGATGDELEMLSSQAKEMGATTSFTATESAEALSYMALAGWDAEEMAAGLGPVLNLAASAGMSLGEASDIVTDYLTAFGMSASDTAGFVDIMAYAMANSNTNVSQLGEAYKSVAATAKSLGFSVEETTAGIMVLSNAGLKGSEAGTALNAVMTRLATDTKGCATALKEYGVEVYDAEGNMNSLSSILGGMATVWDTMTDAQQASIAKTIAGTSHYSALQIVMNACAASADGGASAFEEYAAALEGCSGSAESMAATMLDNMNGQITLMNSAIDGLKIAIGEEFAPSMTEMYEAATKAFSWMTEVVQEHPGAVKALAALVAGLASATSALLAMAAAKKVMAAIDLATMFTSPLGAITLAVGAVAGLTAGIMELYKSFKMASGEISEYTQAVSRISDAEEKFQETKAAIDEEAQSTGALIDRLEELTGKSSLTAAEQEEVASIVAELNEQVPDLSLSYNNLTNSINMTVEAIRAETQALMDQREYQALQEELVELEASREAIYQDVADTASDLIDAEMELQSMTRSEAEIAEMTTGEWIEYRGELEAAEIEVENMTDLYNDAKATQLSYEESIAGITNRMLELTGATTNATGAAKSYSTASGASTKKQLQLQYAAQAVAEGYMDADHAAQMYSLSIDELNEYTGEGSTHSDDLAAALGAVEGGYLTADKAAEVFGVTVDEINGLAAEEKAQSIRDATLELAEAYAQAYQAAYDSFSGQYKLWEDADEVATSSVQTLQGHLDSQIEYWNNYGTNLDTVQSKIDAMASQGYDVSGIQSYLNTINDGSTDAAGAIAGLAEASGTELLAIGDSYSELQGEISDAATTTAEASDEVQTAMDNLMTTISDGVGEMDMSEEALTAAGNTMLGYAQGLEENNTFGEWFTTAATSWLDALAAALGVHSPSTITMDQGMNTMLGFEEGVNSELGPVITMMTSAGNQATQAFGSAMSEAKFYSYGQNAIQGAINGINSMIPSLVAAASNAGTQASNAYKAAQDINSPSKVFEWFGEMDMMGAIKGIEGSMDEANRAFAAAGEANAMAYASGGTNALSRTDAVSAGGGESSIVIDFSPIYNLSGMAGASDLRGVLTDHDLNLRAQIEQILQDVQHNQLRRAYR